MIADYSQGERQQPQKWFARPRRWEIPTVGAYRVQMTIDPQPVDEVRSYCAGIVPALE
jgi:hypothetical protein